MTHAASSRKLQRAWHYGSALTLGFMLACSSPLAAARRLPAHSSIDSPGLVQMIDGKDQGDQVRIGISAPQLWRDGYDFGYMDGQTFYSLLDCARQGCATFDGGALMDFALRRRDDNQYYRLSDSADYAMQDYFVPVNPANSRNPVVKERYFEKLMLFWDLDQDHDRDFKVTLWAQSRFDGMQYVTGSPSPVPLPSSLWLLGSGSLMLAVLGIFKKRPRESPQVS